MSHETLRTETISTTCSTIVLTFNSDPKGFFTKIEATDLKGHVRTIEKGRTFWRDHAAETFAANVRIAKRMEIS